MLYNELSNDPIKRRKSFYTYVTWNDGFSNEEIDNVIKFCEKEPLTDGQIIYSAYNKDVESYRRSKVRFIKKNDETGWIFDRFNRIITRINNEFYGFNLNGYSFFQYTTYNSNVNGMYDWHMDTIMNENNASQFDEIRKLSIVMLLSEPQVEFKGGEFQINEGLESSSGHIDMCKGRIIAFPSFMIHRVKPVISGFRRSIVLWVEGPKFI